jgi:hypothetical protein
VIHLLEAEKFDSIARQSGITQTARELITAGHLTPVVVGRRTFYRWMDVLAVMPPWARKQHARKAVTLTASGQHRSGLEGRTVTLEGATRLVARRAGALPDDLVAVVRQDGALVEALGVPCGRAPVDFARTHAGRISARYVPGGAR